MIITGITPFPLSVHRYKSIVANIIHTMMMTGSPCTKAAQTSRATRNRKSRVAILRGSVSDSTRATVPIVQSQQSDDGKVNSQALSAAK